MIGDDNASVGYECECYLTIVDVTVRHVPDQWTEQEKCFRMEAGSIRNRSEWLGRFMWGWETSVYRYRVREVTPFESSQTSFYDLRRDEVRGCFVGKSLLPSSADHCHVFSRSFLPVTYVFEATSVTLVIV